MKTIENDQNIMSAKQAASNYFENTISYWKLLELVRADKIPYFKIGSRILFRRDALDNWISDLEQNQPPPKISDEVKPLRKTQPN